VLNDWGGFQILLERIAAAVELTRASVHVVAVDDGSEEIRCPADSVLSGCLESVDIVRLNANQGHQRAIALGLAHVHNTGSYDAVVVMDSDGEDKPEAINRLLAQHQKDPDAIIVARRTKRSEGLVFRIFYQIYKWVFHFLTGKPISFGNFSLIPFDRLPNILFNSGVWNNFAATLLRSRVRIRFEPIERGDRIMGESKMGFTGLLIHGFSAISIFTDVVIGRIMLLLGAVSVLAVGVIIWVVITKFFTSTFVPGYATTIILAVISFLGLTLFMGFLIVLSLLAARSNATVLPTVVLSDHVHSVTRIAVAKARSERV
ncbi:MAG: glycosyltransferase, partial [Pseudomonadota bacterium]